MLDDYPRGEQGDNGMFVTANMATYSGRKTVVRKAIDSIRGQVDVVRVYVNDYTPPKYHDNVEYYSGKDLTDRGKFYAIGEEIAFTVDDDILYPPDYVKRTLKAMDKYPTSVVTYHGRKLKGKGLNYYFGHKTFHFLRSVDGDYLIDIPGTGVCAFNTKYFKPDILQYDEDCMADVLLGLEAAKQGRTVICLEHDMWYFRSLISNEDNIYKNHKDDCERQGELCDLIYDLKY